MESFDVIVVGGGPAGAVTARVAAKGGARVLLLESRTEIREPAICAGLVSPRTLPVLGASEACVVRRLRNVSFHSPKGAVLSIQASSDRALVVDRSTLERELLARAREDGAEVRMGVTATAWKDGVLELKASHGPDAAAATVLVGADGPESRVRVWSGLGSTAHRVNATQAEIESADDADCIDVFVGRSVAPGFFAWAIPAQRGRLRTGLAVHQDFAPAPFLDQFLEARFPNHRIVTRVEGAIPIPSGAPIARANVLLVGDAAGQVKPLSGGGLYFGGVCARLAGRAAASAARDPRNSAAVLLRYRAACRGILGPETRFGAAARSARDSLDDTDWEALFSLLNRGDLLSLIGEHVDIDHLRHLVPRLVGHPRFWPLLFAAWDVVRNRMRNVGGVVESPDLHL